MTTEAAPGGGGGEEMGNAGGGGGEDESVNCVVRKYRLKTEDAGREGMRRTGESQGFSRDYQDGDRRMRAGKPRLQNKTERGDSTKDMTKQKEKCDRGRNNNTNTYNYEGDP